MANAFHNGVDLTVGSVDLETIKQRYLRVTKFQITKSIVIAWRGEDSWAVCDMDDVLNRDGDWEFEPFPSSRTDEFKARTRFSLDEAFARAEAEAAKL